MQEAADALMANQGAIVNSIIERTRHEATDERCDCRYRSRGVHGVACHRAREPQGEPSDAQESELIAWHVEQVELLRPFRRSRNHLKAAMMHAATVRALRAAGVVGQEGESRG
ncbi:hypothetical protein [uncultured Microbacterium sp.]|uniref:hypothetical protein n=1 Tax=uncultured Microbacterium sp. TaxID=191216 RepID=UPI0028EDFC22|nr:hypothetical protein [uncultured Microbacterium sp.]